MKSMIPGAIVVLLVIGTHNDREAARIEAGECR